MTRRKQGSSAFVHETQTLVSGATIKMRLAEPIFINGVMIPKGNYVFGTCQLEGERMQIEVKGIRYKNALFPVSLAVYDMDGITGIRIPGAIGRDATKQEPTRFYKGWIYR
ncbi:conjugative transposon protein TraM [Niabella defluvii]|nr:conjugative transposon protein TraM [Niabella sp. I65]